MRLTDSFLDYCAVEYFNGYNNHGIPYQHSSITFEQFVEMKKREIEKVMNK